MAFRLLRSYITLEGQTVTGSWLEQTDDEPVLVGGVGAAVCIMTNEIIYRAVGLSWLSKMNDSEYCCYRMGAPRTGASDTLRKMGCMQGTGHRSQGCGVMRRGEGACMTRNRGRTGGQRQACGEAPLNRCTSHHSCTFPVSTDAHSRQVVGWGVRKIKNR